MGTAAAAPAPASQPTGPTTSANSAVQDPTRLCRTRAIVTGEHRVAKRARKGEVNWKPPQVAAQRHFFHFVLNRMVYQELAYKRTAYEVSSWQWIKADFRDPCRAAHPEAPDPKHYWNGHLPAGLQVFAGAATRPHPAGNGGRLGGGGGDWSGRRKCCAEAPCMLFCAFNEPAW
jgi:hypothetical protein